MDGADGVIETLTKAFETLDGYLAETLIPKTGVELVYARADARDSLGVAAPARTIRTRADVPGAKRSIAFGAQGEAARTVLTAIRFDRSIRSAAALRSSEEALAALEALFFEVCTYDRDAVPPGLQSMDWGIASCCRRGVPDAIVDRGGGDSEHFIRLLGENPLAVVQQIIKIGTWLERA
jgi:hydroxymethylpyrimidine/phosphomethylpyrimidine kinase